ncbi:MAG TPA: nickel pincer cofactor biosynthesis protein LarC [Mycobacteriales bacterium]|nr:nickel pincer cofactor biosynthesis protein LarC [Mycobacteriales bacterium]
MIGWLDCAAGASGDMLLGALVDAGVSVGTLTAAVAALPVEPVEFQVSQVRRHGLAATRVRVRAPATEVRRTWAQIRELLGAADLPAGVVDIAVAAFERLARAEATVHRTTPERVHFHEVGALDAIADVVGTAAGLHALGCAELVAGTVTLGTGTAHGEHGVIPVPGPAVLALLAEAGAPVRAGPAPHEMCTPTGAALLAATVRRWGPLPPMRVTGVGTGAGGRDPAEVPNVLRLVLGEPLEQPEPAAGPADPPRDPAGGDAVVLEANVDDLDPRLWPDVLDRLLAAGAADAWLTPILMKKGRPAHLLALLCAPEAVPGLRELVFSLTSTIGLRELRVGKHALPRRFGEVRVAGQPVRVKVARLGGRVVNVSVEFDDVRAAADALGWPAKEVLRAATSAAYPTG